MLVKIEQEGGVKSIKIAEASDGLNAYQLAVKNDGFVGDYDAWKVTLKGDAGSDANVTSANIVSALGFNPADTANEFNGVYLENKQSIRDFYKKLLAFKANPDSTLVGVSWYGDSVSSHVSNSFIEQLQQSFGRADRQYPAAQSSVLSDTTITGTYVDYTDATLDQVVLEPFKYLPSGGHLELNDGAVLSLTTGASTGYNKVRVYFAKDVGMGSATVEIRNKDTNALIDSAVISLNSASIGATKYEYSALDTATKYKVTVTASGTAIHLRTIFLKPFGIIPVPFGRGGSTFAQNNYSSQAVLEYLLTDFNVGLNFIQAKEENLPQGAQDAILRMSTTSPRVSNIVIGSLPDLRGEIVADENEIYKQSAIANDCVYFNGYAAFKSYGELTRLEWNGDGTHPAVDANQFIATLIHSDLGIKELSSYVTKNIKNSEVYTDKLFLRKGGDDKGYVEPIKAFGGADSGAFILQNIREIKSTPIEGLYTYFENINSYGYHLKSTRGVGQSIFRADRMETAVDAIYDNQLPRWSQVKGYVIAKDGDVTINNVKTFTSSPIVPTPTSDTHAATKKYVDDKVVGATGTFTTVDSKTVTVTNGLITSIV